MQNHVQSDFRHPTTKRLSIAYWSFAPTRRCVVFVHGFGGDAVETWTEFDKRLPTRCDHDIVFFGYDGLFRHATESAVDLLDVLGLIATAPQRLFASATPPPPRRPADFAYERIIIVAHSLGAVVTRRALLDALQAGVPWLDRVRLVFFAPAHMGTRLGALVKEAVGGLTIPGVSAASAAARATFRAFEDLLEGSPVLQTLRADMLAVPLAQRATVSAHTVVWADNDPVVVNGGFPGDPAPQHRFMDLGAQCHTAVCKPASKHPHPVYIVLKAANS